MQQCAPLYAEVLFRGAAQRAREPVPVRVIDQPVREDAQRLVHPQPHRVLHAPQATARRLHPLERLAEVAQVEGVVRAGGRGQQLVQRLGVDLERRVDEFGAEAFEVVTVAASGEPPVDERAEDLALRGVAELGQIDLQALSVRPFRPQIRKRSIQLLSEHTRAEPAQSTVQNAVLTSARVQPVCNRDVCAIRGITTHVQVRSARG